MMHGLDLFRAAVLVGVASAGCQPEVLIASSEPVTAGSGGLATAGTAAGGAGTGGTGGTSAVPNAGEGGTAIVVAPPRLLADSVADFSTTQGEHGWSYGYDTGSLDTFTLMTHTSVITQ